MNRTKRTHFNLKFDDLNFEKKFLIDHSLKSTINFRLSIILGFITAGLFSFVDLWALPETSASAIKIRLSFMLPSLTFVIFLSFKETFYKYIDLAIIFAGITSTLSIGIIISRSHVYESGYDSYYAGILLVNVWITTFVRAKFKPALLTVSANILMYLIIAIYFQDYTQAIDANRINVFYTNLSFFVSINLICLLGCRDMEIYARNEFLQNEILMEDQLKLVDASRLVAVGEMASGMAHEINNPLSIIISSTQAINRKIEDNNLNDEYLKNSLEKMHNAGNRISKIVKSLKIFSRDGSKDQYQSEELTTLINDAIYFCHEKFIHSGIELQVAVIPNVQVLCRITQISQVLINLLNNSYDALIGIENPKVIISFREDFAFVYISVGDTGSGVTDEIRNKIMNPFYTTKPVGKGTGLGLSLSKEIIEQHGGKLILEKNSIPTVFTFSIPKT